MIYKLDIKRYFVDYPESEASVFAKTKEEAIKLILWMLDASDPGVFTKEMIEDLVTEEV